MLERTVYEANTLLMLSKPALRGTLVLRIAICFKLLQMAFKLSLWHIYHIFVVAQRRCRHAVCTDVALDVDETQTLLYIALSVFHELLFDNPRLLYRLAVPLSYKHLLEGFEQQIPPRRSLHPLARAAPESFADKYAFRFEPRHIPSSISSNRPFLTS